MITRITRKFTGLLIMALMTLTARGQFLSELPTEQVFVATDRNAYMRGDTVRVAGQLTSVGRESVVPFSRYVYVELIEGKRDSVLMRRKVSCHQAGQFHAAFPTAALRGSGDGYIRAYTRFMQNFSKGSFGVHPILLGRELPPPGDELASDTCTVVAEGGCILPGVAQNLTVMLTSRNGYPVAGRPVALISASGDTLASATTSPSGFAFLSFMPSGLTDYRVDYGTGATPVTDSAAGLRLSATFSGPRLVYNIRGTEPPKGATLYVYDRLNGLSKVDSPKPDGAITLEQRPAAASLWLTDGDGTVLAECAAIPRYRSRGVIALTTDSAKAGEPLGFSIGGFDADTILSATARLLPASAMPDGGIEEAVNYVSDYDSPLPFPTKWAVSDEATRASDLRAWMATAHFRRFSLTQVIDADSEIFTHAPEDSMTVRGVITDIYGKPFKKHGLVVFNKQTIEAFDGNLDKDGSFSAKVSDFEDGTDFHLHITDKHGQSVSAKAETTPEQYPDVVLDNRLPVHPIHATYYTSDGADTPELGVRLDEVEVTARKKHDPIEDKKFYSTRYKDREIIEKKRYLKLLYILQDIPSIKVIYLGNGSRIQWLIRSTRGASTLELMSEVNPVTGAPLSSSGLTTVQLLIDGERIDLEQYDLYFDMPADQIESVEYLSPGEALIYGSFLDGAVVVKTFGLGKKKVYPPTGVAITPPGLHSAPPMPQPKVPSEPGDYNLIVDITTPTGVHTISRKLSIK